MTDLERLFRRLVDNLIAIDPARLHRPLALGDLLGSVIPYRTNRRSLQIDSVEDYEMLVLRLAAGEGGFVRLASDDVAQVFRDQLESPNPDLEVLREHAKAELFLGTEPLAHALGPGPEEAYAPPEEEFDFPSVIPIDAARTPVPAPDRGEPPNRRAATEPPPGARERDPGARESFRAEPPSQPAARPASPRTTTEPTVRPLFTAEPAAPTPPPPPMVPPVPRMTAEPEPRGRRRDSDVRCSYCGGHLPGGRTVNFCPHCGQNQSLTRCPECQSELELGWKHCISCGHPVGEV
ncbi:MAG: zinc ribbon domain-containing protein [Gemmatimonadetes bacterium]|nr:zinc ribbon domain-containing protein [Gemmatimonadota bacterium]